MRLSPRDCATELLEAVPLMMRVIRAEIRSHSSPELTMPQFRTLAFLGRNEGAMLGDVATFLTLTLSAASKLIDGLVVADLVTRESDTVDRRRIVLNLTSLGRAKFAAVRQSAADFLSRRVESLSDSERGQIAEAMQILQRTFSDAPPETNGRAPKGTRYKIAS
jgi:DNA-binding MarR family transcriptional regulator